MRGSAVSRGLALFDFDKTLSDRDTLFDFHCCHFGTFRVYSWALRHFPTLLGCPLGWSDRGAVKQAFLRHFWKGVPYEDFAQAAHKYSLEKMPRTLRPRALEVLQKHLERGDRVLVISASIKEWLEPWCFDAGISQVLGTEMEVRDGVLTGSLQTPNCRGPEKIRRLREVLLPEEYSPIYAYGDSDGDKEMLALADFPVYRWRTGS
ncbi:MAG TPA: HAD-IB family hydrolase [Synergistaceae bacterium]|nr:HAD-IB family hydrolase [Synergistaceae bacterium]